MRARLVLLAAGLALVGWAAWSAPPAAAQGEPDARASRAEIALARAYAPVIRLVDQPEECEAGEPYEPLDVDLLMDNDEVALRGPWDSTNIVAIAPSAERLGRGLAGYNLDFPGNALEPGCSYERLSKRLLGEAPSTIYARVVTEDGVPGKLALQYWFYYLFNDWNNTHEGDWEMIQIVFDADTPEQALARGPTEVGYSQHSSAERADWGDEKLEIVGGTHPVVYPAAGSHANFFAPGLYLMRSDLEGVGCDDTTEPSRTLPGPRLVTIPTTRDDYLAGYPWLGFEGHWGERQASFFNGPTGPNMKTQWERPITWSRNRWRDTSFTVPGGALLSTRATDIFCGAIAEGSEALRVAKANPGAAALVVGGLVVLALWGLSRTRWEPSSPLPIARARAWGQLLSSAGRMYGRRPLLFLGIGLLFVPLGLLITGLQWLLFQVVAFAPLVDEAGESNAFVGGLAVVIGLVFTLLGLAVVQAATARALADIDAGRRATPIAAYRPLLRRIGPLALALVVAAVVVVVLDLTVVLVPVAAFWMVRWSLIGVVAGAEEPRSSMALLGRSAALSRGHWWRVASIVFGVTAVALLLGPAVGIAILVFTGAGFNLVNLIASVVYVAALPFAALVTAYLHADLRVRHEEAEAAERAQAPPAPPAEPA